jgi:hypothetical protein
MYHYVYLSYELDGQMYIGSRTSSVLPEEDAYFGSYRSKTFNPTHKKVLKTFSTRQAADKWEEYLHEVNSVDTSPRFANLVKQKDQRHYIGDCNPAKRPAARRKISASKRGPNNPMCKTRHFRSPCGMLHTVECLADFAKLNGLDAGHLSKVALGTRKTHKGWTLP